MTRQGAENQATNVLEQKGDRSHSTRLNDTADGFTRDGYGSHGIGVTPGALLGGKEPMLKLRRPLVTSDRGDSCPRSSVESRG